MASGVKTADVPTSFVRPEQARSPITLGQTKDLRISLADPCSLILYMPWFFLPSSSRLSEGQTCGVLRRVLSTKGKVAKEQTITKLTNALAPVHHEVVNESYKHNDPKGAESHFAVFVVSGSFDGRNVLARHRLVSGELQK